MKRVLIISPHFPPINAPDMQRVRMSLPYYRAHGWDPVVLAVRPDDVEGVLEPELSATIPADVPVVRCGAWPLRWTRRVGIGTIGLRSLRSLRQAGAELLARQRFDLVFLSNTQFISFTLGRYWKRRYGVPYVLDVQDPWRTDYYERKGSRRPPGGWKYQFARLQAALLEGWCFEGAAGVMGVSDRYIEDLRARYPRFRAPAEVIGFGASEADIAAALSGPKPANDYVRRPGEIHLLYTGASGPVMPHALTVLFDALRTFRERHPDEAKRLRFHFFGTSYVPPGRGRCSVVPVARACGVEDQIEEIPHRLGHLECIRLQSEADVLVLPGSSDLAYSPSKTYPYYLSRVPILGLVFRDSVMERLLDDLNCAFLVRFREDEDKAEAHAALHRFFGALVDGRVADLMPARNDAYFSRHYLAESLARRQCDLFERALAWEREHSR